MADITDEVQSFFNKEIETYKKEHAERKDEKNFAIFLFLCLKYFFYDDSTIDFSDDEIWGQICDKANDGSIDAICNDTSSDTKDIVFIQSKYLITSSLDKTTVIGEVKEIFDTENQLLNRQTANYNDNLVTLFYEAMDEASPYIQKNSSVKYFTSYVPKKKEAMKLKEYLFDNYKDKAEIFFGDEIKERFETCQTANNIVSNGEFNIDNTSNSLSYKDSIMVNISALSIKDAFLRRKRSLLGLNLRYFIKSPAIDSGIKKTITATPEKFWFFNNGLVFICDDYSLSGRVLTLTNYSIINGGQTTELIGKTNFLTDFFIPCKVIKNSGQYGDDFATEVAKATNSQKPIKAKDLKANTPEQKALGIELERLGVQYVIKSGDKIRKEFSDTSKHTNLEQIGKLGMAAMLQYPGYARNAMAKMFDDDKYYRIFKDTDPQIYVDLLKIDTLYRYFISSSKAKSTANYEITRNARTFVIGAISYLSFIMQFGAFEQLAKIQIDSGLPNGDYKALQDGLISKMHCIIVNRCDDERDLFINLFIDICGFIADRYDAMYEGKSEDERVSPSNYLKSNEKQIAILKKINQEMLKSGTTFVNTASRLFSVDN